MQQKITDFTDTSTDAETNSETDAFEFDDYGPTKRRPIPEQEFAFVPGTTIDKRELVGTGVSASDWDVLRRVSTKDGDIFHLDDEDRRDRETVPPDIQANSRKSGKSAKEPATDGGESVVGDVEEISDGGVYRYRKGEGDRHTFRAEWWSDESHLTMYYRDGYVADVPRENIKDQVAAEKIVVEAAGQEADEDGQDDDTATDGGVAVDGQDDDSPPVADPGDPTPNAEVLLIEEPAGALNCAPSIITAAVSSTGKTIVIPPEEGFKEGTRYLNTAEIFAGERNSRESTLYELYTPGRYRSCQLSNYGPGPQAGANQKSDIDDLPEPTHWPDTDEPADAPDECPHCEQAGVWSSKARAWCERCGELVPEEESEKSEAKQRCEQLRERVHAIERADVLLLDSHQGEYLVTRAHRDVSGTLQRFTLVDEDSRKFTLNVRLHGETIFELEPETEPTAVVTNVDAMDGIKDFEVKRSDTQWLKRWVQETREEGRR